MRSLPIAALSAFICLGSMAFAQDDTPSGDVNCMPTRQADADRMYRKNIKKYAGNDEVLVLPGLVAKRKEKRVEVITETTPVSKEDAVEFLAVDATSSHGYESFMWSYAKPSDIRRALEFIGVPAGTAYNPQVLQFWAKGERIVASIKDNDGKAVRLEELIYDKTTKKSLPPKGFIFTGSKLIPDPHDPSKTIIQADKYEPRAVIAGFSASDSVLEPSLPINQGDAYQSYQIHPDCNFGENEIHTLLLEPEFKDGTRCVRELTLTIKDRQTFLMTDEEGKPLNSDTSTQGMLGKCLEIIRSGQEPFITIKFNDQLNLRDLQQIAGPLAVLDRPAALRIDPPAEGHLYYRSFIPQESWRNPEERVTQSWEVHISRNAGGLTATMVIYDEILKDVSVKPELQKRSFSAPDAEAIQKCIDDDVDAEGNHAARPKPRVLFVYAPPDLKYDELLKFLGPILKTYKTIHVYLEPPTTPASEQP